MRPATEINLQELDVKLTTNNMVMLEQGEDSRIVLHPAQVRLVCDCLMAVAEAVIATGRPSRE